MNDIVYTDAQQRRIARLVPELIAARELLLDLVSKALRVRYRAATAGFLWAVLHPLLMMLILSLVFGRLQGGRLEAFGVQLPVPYHAFLLTALVPWQFFAAALPRGTTSLIEHKELVQKIYFPREVLPIATTMEALVNFAIGLVLLFVVLLISGVVPGARAFWLVPVFALQFALVLGLAFLLSCANVFYRDVELVVDVAVMLGFYASPVIYPVQFVAAQSPMIHRLYMLNPMAVLLQGYRYALLGWPEPPSPLHWAWATVLAASLLFGGACVFRKKACHFADHL